MTPKSHTELWDRIFFRDHLRQYPEIAKEYESLKFELTTKFSKDRRNFKQGKTDFVIKIREVVKKRHLQLTND